MKLKIKLIDAILVVGLAIMSLMITIVVLMTVYRQPTEVLGLIMWVLGSLSVALLITFVVLTEIQKVRDWKKIKVYLNYLKNYEKPK